MGSWWARLSSTLAAAKARLGAKQGATQEAKSEAQQEAQPEGQPEAQRMTLGAALQRGCAQARAWWTARRSSWAHFAASSEQVQVPRDDLRWRRSLVVAALMVVLVGIASVVMTNHITATERERCFECLYNEGSDMASFVQHSLAHDHEELELLAAIVAQSDDFADPKLWQLLSSFDAVGFMSQIALLLPDDTVIYGTGQKLDATGQLSFAREAEKGVHISERSSSLLNPEELVLRHFVPITRDGQVVGLLYGLVMLERLSLPLTVMPYSGTGALYLIEGNSGNYLIDTWHDEPLGNIWQQGERKLAPGYDYQEFKRELTQGTPGVLIYSSRTIGEYVYYHYRPVGINDWRVAVSVPERIVMANAQHIEDMLNNFLLIEFICFALYLLWVLNDARLMAALKQRRLDNIQHLHEIEQFLFNAHEKKENLFAAIEQMGKIMGAERINFWLLDHGINHHYHWEQGQPTEEDGPVDQFNVVHLLKTFAQGSNLVAARSPQEMADFVAADTAPRNFMAVPVRDIVAGQLSGVLALSNIKPGAANVPLLQALGFSFGMYCNNVKNRADLQEQGDRDALTGMFNRNRYERDLPDIFKRYREDLACIYIDVNGLREMNNTKGHDLGDIMLRTVAQAIGSFFPDNYKYRVGGDEFVLFVPGAGAAHLEQSSHDLAQHLLAHDYHISVGIEREQQVETIAQLIKAAEHKMYDQKRAFYATRERRMHVA